MISDPRTSAAGLAYHSLRYARLRLEMLELDLMMERERIGAVLFHAALLYFAALLAIQLIALLLVLASWAAPWRAYVVAGMVLMAVLAAAYAWRRVRQLRRATGRPLASFVQCLDFKQELPANDST